jgi:hypothetical protein
MSSANGMTTLTATMARTITTAGTNPSGTGLLGD